MGRDLTGLKKKPRSGGALPGAGRKDGRGKGGSPGRSQDSRDGNQIKLFSWLLALSLFLLPATAGAWSGKVVGIIIDGDSITVLH
jgi:hypothetical protein